MHMLNPHLGLDLMRELFFPLTVCLGTAQVLQLSLSGKTTNMLEELKSYQLNRVQLHQYCGNWEVTYPRFGASFEEIQDLQDVHLLAFNDQQEEEEDTFLERCSIVEVKELDLVYTCINCK